MKEEDYSGSLESMVWLRARTNSLNLGENSWQRNREICVGSKLKKDSDKKNISESDKKEILVKTVIREKK